MIQKIKNKLDNLNRRREREYLDLTTPDYQNDKKWQYLPFKIVSRPYHRWAVVVAILIVSLAIIPILNVAITIPLAIKFLGRFG